MSSVANNITVREAWTGRPKSVTKQRAGITRI